MRNNRTNTSIAAFSTPRAAGRAGVDADRVARGDGAPGPGATDREGVACAARAPADDPWRDYFTLTQRLPRGAARALDALERR